MMNTNFNHKNPLTDKRKRIGQVKIIDPLGQLILDDHAYVEILARDYSYAALPIWIEAENLLLFTDLPNNKIHYWKKEYPSPKNYLENIDFIGSNANKGELNSSVLHFNSTGKINLFLYGSEKIAKMTAGLREPKFSFSTWINNPKKYQLSSPSHFIEDQKGNIFFTDTILIDEANTTKKKASYGLYKISVKNKLELVLESTLSPEGLSFSTDYSFLYINYSNKKKSYLYQYPIIKNRILSDDIKVFDYTPFISNIDERAKGLKTDKFGNIYTTGPEGLWIFNSDLILIARVYLPEPITDCVFADHFKTLFITTKTQLLKLTLRN